MAEFVKQITVVNGRVTDVQPDQVDTDAMVPTGVTAGSYTSADITVDAAGRITAAANGSGGGGGVTDGDKGDITVSSSGATWTIDDGAVTPAKMNNGAAFSVLGRYTTGSGVRADIVAANVDLDPSLLVFDSSSDLRFHSGPATGSWLPFWSFGSGVWESAEVTVDTVAGLLAFGGDGGGIQWVQSGTPGIVTGDGVNVSFGTLDLGNLTDYFTGQLSLASGGTGASLADPGADRLLFWDDSAGASDWLTVGTGLSITGTTISATGSGGTVTSVDGASSASGFTLTGGPITGSGTLTLAVSSAATARATLGAAASGAVASSGLTMTTDRLLGRVTAGTGAIEELQVGIGLSIVAGPVLELAGAIRYLNGLTPAADRLAYYTGSTTTALATFTAFGRSLVDDADAAAARATLGLVIGTNVQAYDAELAAIAGLTSAADAAPYFTGSGTAALMTVTSAARTVLDDTTVGAMLTTLGGQPLDATLTAFAALTIAANSLTIGTGADAFSQTTFAANTFPARASTGSLVAKTITDFGLSLVDDADAAAGRTTLGLGTSATVDTGTSGTKVALTDGANQWSATQRFINSSGITILDTDASHTLGIIVGSNLSANRTLTLTTGDASRTVTLSADLTVSATATVSGTNTGDQTITLTGDVTGSGTGSFAATIGANKVTDAMVRQSAGLSVIGRSASTTGNVADITAASDGQVMRRSGTSIGFGAVDLASANSITGDLPFANLAQGSALSVLGVTGNATADVASIAAGSDGQVLRRSGTSLAFGTVNRATGLAAAPACLVYHSTTQSVANTTWTSLTFDSETEDTDAFHSTGTNPTRLTIPSGLGGLYLLVASFNFASNATGMRLARFLKNGTTQVPAVDYRPAISGDGTFLTISTLTRLAAGDYVELQGYQSSGGSLNVTGGSTQMQFGATFIGA